MICDLFISAEDHGSHGNLINSIRLGGWMNFRGRIERESIRGISGPPLCLSCTLGFAKFK